MPFAAALSSASYRSGRAGRQALVPAVIVATEGPGGSRAVPGIESPMVCTADEVLACPEKIAAGEVSSSAWHDGPRNGGTVAGLETVTVVEMG